MPSTTEKYPATSASIARHLPALRPARLKTFHSDPSELPDATSSYAARIRSTGTAGVVTWSSGGASIVTGYAVVEHLELGALTAALCVGPVPRGLGQQGAGVDPLPSAQTSSDPASELSESSEVNFPSASTWAGIADGSPGRDPVPRGRRSADHVGADHLGVRTHRLQHAEVPRDVERAPHGAQRGAHPGHPNPGPRLGRGERSSVGTYGRCLEVRVAVDDARLALRRRQPATRLGPGARGRAFVGEVDLTLVVTDGRSAPVRGSERALEPRGAGGLACRPRSS